MAGDRWIDKARGKSTLAFFRWTIVACVVLVLGVSSGRAQTALKVEARSAMLEEVATGEVLFTQNADEPIAPASFTKMLTLYLVFEALEEGHARLDDQVWVSEKAWRTGGSRMFIEVGDKVPLEELIKGIAVVSGNDACVAVAEHLYGSVDAFVEAMNRKARELGMAHSHFENPNGLPADGQLTTARDMATLARAYIQRFPNALRYHSMTEYTYNGITQPNRNRLLLKDASVDGLKTGYVASAGYHLAATARRDGMRLLAVVMGAASPATREREAHKLLNYGFRQYVLVAPPDPASPLAVLRVWKGAVDEVSLYPKTSRPIVLKKELRQGLRWELKVPESVTAPLEAGQVQGETLLKSGDEILARVELINRQPVPAGGLLKRLWHSLLLMRLNGLARWWKAAGGVALMAVLVGLVWIRARAKRRRKQRWQLR
ncbi:D-alanyl-D-alanine carboxypeptidase (penicillin-binding protein 5/6) [Desulfacinum hydrothermale DSM 13146]|uniref:serine-type D-Ala-D-Ala carboxypeptidase n=1 Tax=Desulfacinum hydrothermale DSM 13146 TaxID=1121390 RepID=A0A1W1XJH8_9BACT|nr:D-alanyl-D-alanine carboxypeptidase family protein [Desulfacinum hydrothermale]SMC24115.1 D-alanyl-D-alanine carboxypeptidase (penicillin-binding protein 5/6) [Desulfacinum hydrothermale DSM 13146]